MSVLMIHLSDIHIRSDRDAILKKGEAIASSLYSSVATASLIVIVVSGDVAFSGTKKQYLAARLFLEEIKKRLKKEARCDVQILVCPGNHDCDFTTNNGSRKNNIASVQASGDVDDSVINACTRIQNEFFKFRDEIETWKDFDGDRLWRTYRIDAEGKKIVFDALNVAWVSNLREDKNLFFPVERYREKTSAEASDARVIVFHHPLNWFSQSSYRPFRKHLRELGSILVSGHEHEGNVGQIDESETGTSLYIEGKVLQHSPTDLSNTGFYVVELDLGDMVFTATEFSYAGDGYKRDANSRAWKMPSPKNGVPTLAADFRRVIEDAGAISHPDISVPVSLQDIYVYPHLRKVHERGKTSKFSDAKVLLAPDSTRGGVILKSDERTGSTSLLYQLFLGYLDKGFAPVLLNGADIKRSKPSHIDSLVADAVRKQYAKESQDEITRRSRSEKILLVDDIDDAKVLDTKGRAEMLSYLRKLADHLVVVVSGSFGLDEILEEDNTEDLVEMEFYEIQPFGYTKRAELVKRWIGLGGRSMDGADLISECDRNERLIASAMHKSLIPSAPLYLLTLLQSVNAGKSADLKESSLGHYYEFLLTEALMKAGVSRAKLTSHYQYATYLAWEYSASPSRRLNKEQLRDFNQRFSSEYFSSNFEAELELLLTARILIECGDEYEFRYPYMYYHLKGRYLASNLTDPNIQNYVARCCNHLYVRDHANTILFLAHHSNNEWLLSTMKDSMTKLFHGFDPIHFNGDTTPINELISDAPALIYHGGTPEEHRDKKNREMDEMDEGDGSRDGMMDVEETSESLSLSSQIIMLFKTTEILGQILKNQYSTIRRPVKRDLLHTLFDGNLKAINRFFNSVGDNSDRTLSRVKKAIEETGKVSDTSQRDKLARRFLAEIIQSISVGIIAHAAASINSDDLSEEIADAVKGSTLKDTDREEVSTAYRIIELAVRLDSAKPIPRVLLQDLYELKKSDLIANRIIKLLVLTRLYMFKTSEHDMRWIASTIEIPLTQQHQIAYASGGRKIG
ncbi:metallophosphoesterase [Stenotrophomonas chelatiphaga]|uniref:metallophosphoesterase n=1 Tax=Stenotrophomonas chelatiphaga TaxID=517011 RepID=UPI00289E2338|nr:metallophosphoesterase [Stenotrophomonas chelatiphaga]